MSVNRALTPSHGRRVRTQQIRKQLRVEVFNQGRGECFYCGLSLQNDTGNPSSEASTDHVIPLSRGGREVPGNLVPACVACNIRKQSKTLEEFRLSEFTRSHAGRIYGLLTEAADLGEVPNDAGIPYLSHADRETLERMAEALLRRYPMPRFHGEQKGYFPELVTLGMLAISEEVQK